MTGEAAFDTDHFKSLLRGRELGLGEPFSYQSVTTSTNDDALKAARTGAPDGSTFLAEYQTRGRGRRGRSWVAEPGTSLLCSLLLRRPLRPELLATLALVAGLGVRSAIERAVRSASSHADVRVKWPNDVWLDGRKVAGILCESQIEAGKVSAIVIGFGINVSASSFPPELGESTTSLRLASSDVSREQLLANVFEELAPRLSELERFGFENLRAEFARQDALSGRSVRVDGAQGIASGIDDEGRLLIKPSTSACIAISAGTVELEPVSAGDTPA